VTKVYKTTVNNQQIINLNMYSDVENGAKELQSVGYVTLDGELPKDSDIVVEFEMDLNENVTCLVYPKGQISKKKRVLLGRGTDSVGIPLNKITELLEEVDSDKYDLAQKEQFYKAAKTQLLEAEKLDPENPEHRNLFFKINYDISNEFDGLQKLKETKTQSEERELLLSQATLMVDNYASLLGTSETARMKRLIYEIQEQEDIIVSSNAIESLKGSINKHQFILDIFLLKIASSKASKSNPSDANLILKKHDVVVTYLVNGDFENGFDVLNEAWKTAIKYFDEGSKEKFGRFLKR
jgi:molecular chaperone DnaK